MMDYDKVRKAADDIAARIPELPAVGVILGSGLGGLVDIMTDRITIPYADIPFFPKDTIQGQAGNFVFGRIGGVMTAAMQGRFHYYQGYSMEQVTFPVYVMRLLGIRRLIITNAAGGVNTDFAPGDLMVITDHINITGKNSLIGENDERFGVRFPDMSEPYSRTWIAQAEKTADSMGIPYQEGVYMYFPGPCYETAAEIRAFRTMGADATGMSTVPEVIAANYLGMEVLGISCITNMATGIAGTRHTHEEVLRIAGESSRKLCRWVQAVIEAEGTAEGEK